MRFRVFWACLLLLTLSVAPPATGGDAEPAQLLQEQFQLQLNGQVWEQADEPMLQRRLRKLAELRHQIRSERRDLAALARKNFQSWERIQQEIRVLKGKRAALATGDSERKKIDDRLKDLQRQAIDPQDLCGCGHVMTRLQRLVDLELEAARKALWARRVLESLRERHAQLGQLREVTLALQRLGQRLSSPERYRDAPGELSEVESLVLSDATPLYRQNGQLRFGVLLNDECPATFSWDENGEHHFIPFTMSQLAGLQPAADVPPRRLEVVKGRTFQVRQVVIPQLRVGRHVMRDVKAWRLPPAGEDLGARLGRNAAAPWQLQPEPQRLRLRVSPP